MAYYIRTKSGEAKAKLDNDMAGRIIRDCPGHWREAKYKTGSKTVFEIDRDMTFGNDRYKIMLWVGDVMEPLDEAF